MPKLYALIRTARRSGATTINLAKRRTWYGEGDGAGEQQGQQGEGEGSVPTTIEGWQKLAEAREKRLKERDEAIKQLKTQFGSVNERLTAKEQAEQKRLLEQGNFQELAQQRLVEVESLKPIAERAAALEKIIRSSNEERIKTIPDSKKNLVQPLIDVLPPEKLQEYLNANPDLFVKTPAPDFDAGAGAGGSGSGGQAVRLTEDQKQMAKLAGMTEKEYADYLGKKGQPVEQKKK
jgi:hypothetical protein